MCSPAPYLSIVTCTLGRPGAGWVESMLAVRGDDVEFIWVVPPGTRMDRPKDTRVRLLVSPFRGELIQRYTGLLNARGRFLMAVDDDDFVHPEIRVLCERYFSRFPESWVLRPSIRHVSPSTGEQSTWPPLPPVFPDDPSSVASEIPIAPLARPPDWSVILAGRARRDQEGRHIENFNNRLWRREVVEPALTLLSDRMRVFGAAKWVPCWSLDRLLGLFIQAIDFKPGRSIGHAICGSVEQVRFSLRDGSVKQVRFHVTADLLLLLAFPRFGYFWNLVASHLWSLPTRAVRALIRRGPRDALSRWWASIVTATPGQRA